MYSVYMYMYMCKHMFVYKHDIMYMYMYLTSDPYCYCMYMYMYTWGSGSQPWYSGTLSMSNIAISEVNSNPLTLSNFTFTSRPVCSWEERI